MMLERQKAALRHCLEELKPAGRLMLLGFYRDRMSCERLAELHRRSANAALTRCRHPVSSIRHLDSGDSRTISPHCPLPRVSPLSLFA